MKKYFLQFRTNAAKNKAQEELQAFAYTYQNTLCDDAGLSRIVNAFRLKAAVLNEKYHRCKPMKINFNEYDELYGSMSALADTEGYIFSCSIDKVWREEFIQL